VVLPNKSSILNKKNLTWISKSVACSDCERQHLISISIDGILIIIVVVLVITFEK